MTSTHRRWPRWRRTASSDQSPRTSRLNVRPRRLDRRASGILAIGNCESKFRSADKYGRYWARTSDPQLVELVLSQLS